jgi:hypothetical protein
MTFKEHVLDLQQTAIGAIGAAVMSKQAPGDGYERVDFRLDIILQGAYDDDEPEDPAQPVRDLLTDIIHRCRAKGWDLFELLERAQWMADQEGREWDELAQENRRLEDD